MQTSGLTVNRICEQERSLRTCCSSTAQLTNRFTLMHRVGMTRQPYLKAMQASCQRSVNAPCSRVKIIRPWEWCQMTSPTLIESAKLSGAARTTSASTQSNTPIQMEVTCLCRKLYRARARPSIIPTKSETWTTILWLLKLALGVVSMTTAWPRST